MNCCGGVIITYTYSGNEGTVAGDSSISKAFNAMFSIYSGNFKEFFVFLLIFQSMIAFLNILNAVIVYAGIPFVNMLVNIGSAILATLMGAGLIAMAAEAREKGFTSKSSAFSLIGNKAVAIIVVNFIVGLAVLVGLCLCIIPGIIAMVYLIWATIIVVVETAEIGDSLSRSADFTKKHRPYLFILAYIGVAIVIIGFQMIAIGLPQIMLLFGGVTIFGPAVGVEMTLFLISVISALITIPVASLLGPFLPIFITDYYLQTVGSPSEPMLSNEEKMLETTINW